MAGTDDITELARSRVGRVLKDKWTLDRLIGIGGMAAVYAAKHRNGKKVAVKILHPEYSRDETMRKRFLREGYVANRVEHEGALVVDDDDIDEEGAAFLVMELLEGETLEARWARKGRKLPVEEVLALMDQVLSMLVVAHGKSIVHRDLKPENMFLTHKGTVKVLDFGIARLREGASTKTTHHDSFLGTPAFMPPEQARGRWSEIDGRADLWALGASMFTLLSGELVHVSETPNEAVAFAATQRARSIATVAGDLHPAVIELVDRALAYEKESRFPDATSMQKAVRDAYQLVLGKDVSDAAAIAMPEMLPSPGAAPAPSRIELTTAPAKSRTTSGVAAQMPEIPMVPSRWPLVASIAGVLAVGGLVGIILGRDGDGETAPEPPGSELASSPTAPPALTEPAPATPEPSPDAEGTEAFSVDELPPADDDELASATPPATTSLALTPSSVAPLPSEAPSTARPSIAIPNVVLEDAPQPGPGADDPFSKRE